MALLEELAPGVLVKGLLPTGSVTIISIKRHGFIGLELVYQDAGGNLGSELLYSDSVANLEIVPAGLPWSFDADGALFRLTSEAYRIRLAYLFDPLIAVHTSLIEPLPHQITAVYETMLRKQPLRYLLADDPGAGKTIMAWLLIKELMIRGDLRHCLIVAPGNLVEQWQDELKQRFHIVFDILTNDRLEASASGNAFAETPLCIARLDKLSRNESVQDKLRLTEWDLIVVDEAHKMSATFYGGETRYTRRYQLGELLGKITRHLVLLTATPHNGKEEDFQLFLRLLDADRFEGKFRDGVHKVDVSDLVRHLVKEQVYTFDVLGNVLFDHRPLRDLIIEAIRYGDRPDVRARLTLVVDQALEERALAHEVMDVVRVRQVREEMERAAARRLQPHFIASFFLETLKRRVRTVTCPNPACGVQMPLTSKWWLSKKKGKEAWVEPQVDHTTTPPVFRFTVVTGKGKPQDETVNRQGTKCIACGTSVAFDYIRSEGKAGRMQSQLMAIVAEGQGGRVYLAPSQELASIATQAKPSGVPETDLPEQALGFRIQLYGMTKHRDLFTPRQLVALTTFSNLVQEAREKVLADASIAGLPVNGISLNDGGTGANRMLMR